MKKAITRICALMFALCLPFLFSACGNNNLNSTTPTNQDINTNYERSKGGTYNPPKTETPDLEFFVEDGHYTYFAGFWEDFDGVQLASRPTSVDAGEGVSDITKQERQNYFNDVYSQFELLYFYIENYMLCEFDAKVAEEEHISLVSGNYETQFSPFAPEVFATYSESPETEAQILEYNAKIGNTTAGIMGGEVIGWNYVENPATPGEYLFTVKRNENILTKHSFIVDLKNGDSVTNKNFIILRLMEIVLNSQTKTDYGFASNEQNALERIRTYEGNFEGLGFVMGDVSDPQSVAAKVKNMLLEEIIGQNALTYYREAKSFSEPFIDENESGVFEDGEPYLDVNKNGVRDASFSVTTQAFYADFETIITKLVSDLAYIVDGEDGVDVNGNGMIDEKYKALIGVEVQDFDSETFFHPGTPETDTEKRKLTNMEYANYSSIVFAPNVEGSDRLIFNLFDIYVDSETDFVLDLYLKVFLNEDNYFVCKVSTLALDSSKSCDWSNGNDKDSDINKIEGKDDEYENPFEELFDSSVKHNAFSWIMLSDEIDYEDVFEYVTKNRPNDYILKCSNQGSLTDAETMRAMISKPNGVGELDSDLSYMGRGYHTSLTDNTSLTEKYSYQEINKNGDTALCYVSEGPYMEFIFDVVNEDPTVDYNFKFLIQPQNWTEEE